MFQGFVDEMIVVDQFILRDDKKSSIELQIIHCIEVNIQKIIYNIQLILFVILKMQPRRPDSAKSRVTQKTLDTELNQSKFSQTFTSYTTFNIQKKDEFIKYLEEKQKDPKFKKFNQPTLPQIPQKPTRQQLAKINSKPFQKRNSKITSKPKIQQPPKQITTNTKQNLQSSAGSKWTVNHPQNGIKKENKLQTNNSQSFAEKNKQKMNMITAGLKKVENEEKKTDKKIEFKGFKMNAPGKKQPNNKVNQEQKQAQNEFMGTNIGTINGEKAKPNQQIASSPQTSNGTKKQSQKPKEKTQQQLKRQQELLEISRFINQVEMKNIDYYPEGYQEFVQRNQSHSPEDLDKININDFLIEPTQRDYQKMQRKIKNNQKKLMDQQNLSQSRVSSTSSNQNQSSNQTSIDLDKLIDGDSESQANRQNDQQQNEIFLSSISSKDLKQRNLFLTEVLKGRVTKQDITKLQQMDKSHIKLKKLQEQVKQDEDIEIMEINMMKKKSNRIFERNIVQASGQIYRDCDYLSEQNKLRLQRLLNGEMDPSPFEVSEWERFAMRRIDQGIRLYRELSNSSNDMTQQVIPQELLPKDPNLRKQAQKKMLKQKIDSINSRLQQIQNIVVNQAKIQSLIEQHRTTRIAQSTQALIDQRHKEMSQLQEKSKQAAQMILKAEKEKGEIESALKQMELSYKKFQQECKAFQKLSLEQIAKRQRQEINQKKRKIQEITKSLKEIQQGTQQTIQNFHHQIQHQISILRQIQNLSNTNTIVYQGLELDLTDANLDAKFQTKANQDQKVVAQKLRLFGEEEKENQSLL